ncbi:MAG: putative metalloprotease CJM1_0395 family protein [bacterium]|nr:putative metalloprotease CJM1_0395 family protein [bacterium]
MPSIGPIGRNVNPYTFMLKRQEQRAPGELSESEKKEVEGLRKRDREVRQHEQAHIIASGGYAIGGPHYKYRRGPDGRLYAVGGEVSIDASMPDDPDEAIRKAQAIRRGALAPGHPSQHDMMVAAEASRMEMEARQEKIEKMREEFEEGKEGKEKTPGVEGIDGIVNEIIVKNGIDKDMITPEVEKKIIDKKRQNPEMSVEAIKRELKQEGIEISEEEIRRILRKNNLEKEEKGAIFVILNNQIFNKQRVGEIGESFDMVA